MKKKIEVSIIVPCYNEEKYIKKCLNSILKSDYKLSLENSEIIIVDGMSTDRTRDILKDFINNYSFIKMIDNVKKAQVYGLNLALKESRGKIIVRLDAHCKFPKDYISQLLKAHKESSAMNIGGVIETFPGDNTIKAKAIAEVMKHPLGMGGKTFRTISNERKAKIVDTVPFGCWKKEVFKELGNFDEVFIRDQDYEHNVRIRKAKGKILLLPWVKIDYYARENWEKTWKMFFQYGYWRPLLNKKHKMLTNFRQLVPPVWVLGMVVSWMLLGSKLRVLSLLYFLGYLIPVLFCSFKIAKQKEYSLKMVLSLIISFFIIHTSYGVGHLKGILDVFILRKIEGSKQMKEVTR